MADPNRAGSIFERVLAAGADAGSELERCCAEHPHHADELRGLWEARERLVRDLRGNSDSKILHSTDGTFVER